MPPELRNDAGRDVGDAGVVASKPSSDLPGLRPVGGAASGGKPSITLYFTERRARAAGSAGVADGAAPGAAAPAA